MPAARSVQEPGSTLVPERPHMSGHGARRGDAALGSTWTDPDPGVLTVNAGPMAGRPRPVGIRGRLSVSARRPRWELVAALVTYAALSALLFGRDVVGQLSQRVVGDVGADKTLYMWGLEWWPRALRHGLNPLDVNVDWMPNGFDLGLGTAGGGLAIVATPLTETLGPIATYNVLILAAPALAATTAFLLARYLTGQFGPAFIAGWVFGFSSI